MAKWGIWHKQLTKGVVGVHKWIEKKMEENVTKLAKWKRGKTNNYGGFCHHWKKRPDFF
jgi:hypothetical protein